MGVIEVPREIPEPDMEEWDPSELSKLPKDLKKDIRREIHWMYWMMGKTYKQINAITGFHRSTIWEDIKWVQGHLNVSPQSMENIRQMAMMTLRFDHAEILETIREAKKRPKPPWNAISKLYEVAGRINEHILTRYTPPAALQGSRMPDMEKQLRAMVKFVVHKLGPEGLDGFDEYFAAQLKLQDSLA